MFIKMLFSDPAYYIMAVAVVMFSICCHEYAHAWMALREGDSTAADDGHMTLDPRKQMGTFSIIMLLVVGIAWGAVPVSPWRFRRKASQALISFAGPAANILLFLACAVLLGILQVYGDHLSNAGLITGFKTMFLVGAVMNALLALFNMLPLPMLDGWKVFAYLIPRLEEVNPEVRNGLGLVVFMGLMLGGFEYFYRIAGGLTAFVVALVMKPLMMLSGAA
jgi:Zn-dependent protease